MCTEMLERYFAGDERRERDAVSRLRHIGEAAARRLGLQPADVDAIGVDFAALMLTQRMTQRCRQASDLTLYLRRAAVWFAAKQRRGVWAHRVVPLDDGTTAATTAGAGPDLTGYVANRQLLEQVRERVRGLSMANQRLFELCIVEGCDCAEAALRLGCTPAAARKLLERLRHCLRRAGITG